MAYSSAPVIGATTDGFCNVGASEAHASGGVMGSPGFDPSQTPGTHVLASAAAKGINAIGSMSYSFSVGGPQVPGGQIAVNIFSAGAAQVTGSGFASAFLVITDTGSDAGIGGPSDPNEGVQDSRFTSLNCMGGACQRIGGSWNATDDLCLTQGDQYKITIVTQATAAAMNTLASASIDPRITVDPVAGGTPTYRASSPPTPAPIRSRSVRGPNRQQRARAGHARPAGLGPSRARRAATAAVARVRCRV